MNKKSFNEVQAELFAENGELMRKVRVAISQSGTLRERSVISLGHAMLVYLDDIRRVIQEALTSAGSSDSPNLSAITRGSAELNASFLGLSRALDSVLGSGEADGRHGNYQKPEALQRLALDTGFLRKLLELLGSVAKSTNIIESLADSSTTKRYSDLTDELDAHIDRASQGLSGPHPEGYRTTNEVSSEGKEQGDTLVPRLDTKEDLKPTWGDALDTLAEKLDSHGLHKLASMLDAVANSTSR